MQSEQYLSEIESVLNKLSNGVGEEVLSELNELYKIKPVRLQWFVAKAQIEAALEAPLPEIEKCINGTYNTTFPYEGVVECLQIKQKLSELDNDVNSQKRYEYIIGQLMNNADNCQILQKYLIDFLNNGLTNEEIIQMCSLLFQEDNLVCHYIVSVYCSKILGTSRQHRYWVETLPNMGYLKEKLNEAGAVFILSIQKQSERYYYYVLGKMLAEMGHNVYILEIPSEMAVDFQIELEQTALISLDNIVEDFGCKLVPLVECVLNEKVLGNNREYVVNYLFNTKQKVCSTVLANSELLDELSRCHILLNNIHNLYFYQQGYLKTKAAFAWGGRYEDYVGQIYGIDVPDIINREAECRFSVVIPARNSTATLRYTLQTCLNQRYQGNYEIVLSDNSTGNNTGVYDLFKELNDSRVRYYKTPRNLHLSKSFEYAILQARGEYIISIGSDDAILPWTLEVLDKMANEHPDDEVFLWERGFYAWPGFNGGQQNQFTIPHEYVKGQYGELYKETLLLLGQALKSPKLMYLMPMLYINSGFKRSYLQTLLKETGRLWDGICQDIYMGVITSVIVPKVLYINYPLAIAGMASGSVGAVSNIAATDMEDGSRRVEEIKKTGNIGGFSMSATERLFPEVTTDVSSLYNSVLRAVDRGILTKDYLKNGADWKLWFLNCFKTMDKKDVYFDRKLHQFRFAAMQHGKEFLEWFDNTIYVDALKPVVFYEKKIEEIRSKKSYVEGKDKFGGITLDASAYGVSNVYEATILFEKMTGL